MPDTTNALPPPAGWPNAIDPNWITTVLFPDRHCEPEFAARRLGVAVAARQPVVAVVDDRTGAGPAEWPAAAVFMVWAAGFRNCVIIYDDVAGAKEARPFAATLADAFGRVVVVETTPEAATRWETAAVSAGRLPLMLPLPATPGSASQ